MLFDYKAIDPHGKRRRGRLSAANLSDLGHRLQRIDLELLHASPAGRTVFSRRFPRKPLINFWFHLAHLLRAGVPLVEGLGDLQAATGHPELRQTIANLIESLEGGKSLSQSLLEHPRIFDPVSTSLVQAGESSGRLLEVMERIQESLKRDDELSSQTKKILLYPTFLAVSVFAAMLFMLIVVVPQLKDFVLNMGRSQPWHTQALFLLSDLLNQHGGLLLALLPLPLLLVMALPRAFPASRHALDRLKLRLPIVGGIIQKVALSRFATTLAMLYAAGIPILEALRSTQGVVGNRGIHAALGEAETAVRNGRNLADAFESTAIFPPLIVRMLKVGEGTGSLDTALLNVSYFYNRDVQESIDQAQALIEPAMTVAIGLLLAWLMLSVLGPIYDIVAQAAV